MGTRSSSYLIALALVVLVVGCAHRAGAPSMTPAALAPSLAVPSDAGAPDVATSDAGAPEVGQRAGASSPYAFPVGDAGGALTGQYPNPGVDAGAVTLAGDVTGAANANAVHTLTGSAGAVAVPAATQLLQTQPNAVAPNLTRLWGIQPYDLTKAPFEVEIGGTSFGGTVDQVMHLGYNAMAQGGTGGGVAAEPSAAYTIEQDWLNGGAHLMEMYFQFAPPGVGSVYRPFVAQYNRTSGDAVITQVNFFGGAGQTGTYSLTDSTTTVYQSVVATGQHTIYGRGTGTSLSLQATTNALLQAGGGVTIEGVGQLQLVGNDAGSASFFQIDASGNVNASTNNTANLNAQVLAMGTGGVAVLAGRAQANVQGTAVALLGNTYKLYDFSATQWATVTPAAAFTWNYAAGVTSVAQQLNGTTETLLTTSALTITPPTLAFDASASLPLFGQNSTSGATGQNLLIVPQQSTNGTNRTGGNLIASLQTPLGTGAEAYVQVTRGGTAEAQIGAYPGVPGFAGIWLGPVGTPTTSNWTYVSNGSTFSYVNAPDPAGSVQLLVNGGAGASFQLGVTDTFLTTTNLHLSSPTVEWQAGVAAPTLKQMAAAADVATQNLTISSQAPFASAVTNKAPGNIVLATPAPVSGGAWGQTVVNAGSHQAAAVTVNSAATNYGMLCLGTTACSPSTAAVEGDGATQLILFTPGPDLFLEPNSGSFIVDLQGTGFNNSIPFVSGLASPTISQVSTSTATQGRSLTIQPQWSTQVTNQGSGDVIVALEAALGTASESALAITRSGTVVAQIQPYTAAPADGAIYLGNIVPAAGNAALISDGATFTAVNAPSGHQVALDVNASAVASFSGTQWQSEVPTIQWDNTVTAPLLTQKTPTSDVATQPMEISTQAPYASAVTNTSAGPLILEIPAPISGNPLGQVRVYSGATINVQMGRYNSSFGGLWLGPTLATSTNFTLYSDDNTSDWNAATTLQLDIANAIQLNLTAGALNWASGVTFPTIGQNALTSTSSGSGAAGQQLLILAQPGQNATGAGNNGGTGGAVSLSSGIGGTSGSASPGAAGQVSLAVGGSVVASFNKTSSDFVAFGASPAASGTIRLPYNSPIAALDSGSTTVNLITLNGTDQVTVGDGSHAALVSLQGASGATIDARVNGAVQLAVTTASVQHTPPLLDFVKGAASPTISQDAQTSDTATNTLTIAAQSALAGASTNLTGGNLVLKGGAGATTNGTGGSVVAALNAPTGTGTEAYLETTRGGTATTFLGPLVGTPADGALYLGITTPTNTNFAIFSNGSTTAVSGPSVVDMDVAGVPVMGATSSTVQYAQPVFGSVGATAFRWGAGTVALTSGSATTLTATQYANPHLKFTGTLSGAGTSVVFPASLGACWDLDFQSVTFASNTITLTANSNSWGTTISGTNLYAHVCYSDAGRLVGALMTQFALEGTAEDWAAWESANDNAAPVLPLASGL